MTPYLSVVMVGRNDNYLGNFLDRLTKSVYNISSLLERDVVDYEIVLVDWNPPEEKPKLGKLHLPVRVLEVPKELHKTIPNSDKIGLFEYYGKNVGIRRAKGEFILVTNPDILFSNRLVETLDFLDKDHFYRTVRKDITEVYYPSPSYLRGIDSKVVRVNKQWDWSYSSFIDYTLWHLRNGLKSRPLTNAAGDFLMMHRDNWFKLNGYPEIPGVAKDGYHHADSLILYEATWLGLKQKVLPGGIYHQNHGDSTKTGKPVTSQVETTGTLIRSKRQLIKNENWGLGNYEIKEE